MRNSVMRLALALTGIALILSAACASPTRYRNALHPAYGQTEFDRDLYECRRENTRPKVSSVVVPNIGTYDAGMAVDEDMARNCLAARGWRPVSPQTLPTAATVRPDASAERERTERFQQRARELLDKPYYQAPFACDDGGWVSVKNYVVDVARWAEAAGLRKGDRLLGFGPISLAQYDSVSEAWAKIPRGDDVTVHIDRAGSELSIRIPCRDSSQAWQPFVGTLRAIVDAQWQKCIDSIQTYVRITRVNSASSLFAQVLCMRERAKAASQPLPEEYWRTLHAWATKVIEEAHYRPAALADARRGLLEASDALSKAGRADLADDLKHQIATFNETPSKR